MKTVAHPGSRGITTALIYTRVSTDEQAREGLSLDAQLAECRRYAARQGWALGPEYQDIMRGTRDDRPDYQRLLATARQLRAERRDAAVVVAALDRFGRKLLERVRAREELKGLGVAVHSVREGGEVSDLVSNILASVAQEEVRRLSERVSATHAHIRSCGWNVPGRVAFGYRAREATPDERKRGAPRTVLDIDPITAPIVLEMFQRVADGESIRAVGRWLARLPADVRRGRTFGTSATRQALIAPVYISRNFKVGRRYIGVQNALDQPRGNWPAIVPDELYARVWERIEAHRRMPRQASGRYLLTGLLRCPRCGLRMRASSRPRVGNPRYVCSAWSRGAAAVDMKCRYQAVGHPLDSAVLEEMAGLIDAVTSTDRELQAALGRAWGALSRPADDGAGLVRTHEAAAGKARERIKRLALLYADGDIDREGYELGRAQAQTDLEAAAVELERLRAAKPAASIPPLDEVIRRAGGWREALADGDVDRQREVLDALIERVVPERVSHGKYRVHVTWSGLGEHLRVLADTARSTDRAA